MKKNISDKYTKNIKNTISITLLQLILVIGFRYLIETYKE